jgi:hypothetical protein
LARAGRVALEQRHQGAAAALVAPIMSAVRPGARNGFSLATSSTSVGVLAAETHRPFDQVGTLPLAVRATCPNGVIDVTISFDLNACRVS